MEKFGIKETTDVLRFGLSVQRGISAARADGEVNWMDATHLIPVVKTASDAINGIDGIKAELLDLSDSEQKELVVVAKEFFPNSKDETVMNKVIATVNWVVDGIQLGVIWFDPEKDVIIRKA